MGVKAQEVGKKLFKESNQYLSTLHDGFQKYLSGVGTLEAAHDGVRTLLYDNDPVLFPSGHRRVQCLCTGHTNLLSCIQSTTIAPQMFSLQ